MEAAHRRLKEEIGVEVDGLREVDVFFYRYPFANGITEFECDHVLVGEYDGSYTLDPEEVDEMRWVDVDELRREMVERAEEFTPWFLICAPVGIRNSEFGIRMLPRSEA